MSTSTDTKPTHAAQSGNSAASAGEDDRQRYPFREIEPKWQEKWAQANVYHTTETGDKPKYYVLDMFPYPSGSGLHVGHCKNYVPGDVVGRMMHMRGYNVLHPMGWDAFGQPAEQDAIKRNVNPRAVVPMLAKEYKRQMSVLGIGYDWNREINSTDPEYYRWNQWAFLLLYERGLAYRINAPVNWCINESTVLANEEVVDGKCWRCDGPVVKRDLPQWMFKITAYAEQLLEGLDKIAWPEGIKISQREWIGRSEGAEVHFAVAGGDDVITVFTTRPDTLWGATFMVLAPEHPLVEQLTTDTQREAVDTYRAKAASASEMDRTAEGREKTGVFTGGYAVNPVNGQPIPVWIADYVLMGYGTGAIMAVPAHDQRDFEFARKYDLPVTLVYATEPDQTSDTMTEALPTGGTFRAELDSPFTGEPNSKDTVRKVIAWLEAQGMGKGRINYRLRDWLVSRQRYWGTPIPIIHCEKCGIVPVPKEDLPVLLPDVENYKPGADGKSPLAAIPEFVHVECPTCGGPAQRETDTMAGSVDSSWYFLRFTSPQDRENPWDRAAADYWMPVDLYLGGREHAVGHLLYCRFFTKVFHDAGLLSVDEPMAALRNQGMLLGYTPVDADSSEKHPIKPDELVGYSLEAFTERFSREGAFRAERVVKPLNEPERVEPVTVEMQWLKMSKSKGNSVTPDEIAERYGADALRLYILFEAPFEDTIQWSEERLVGTFRFLNRVWDLVTGVAPSFQSDWAERLGEATSEEEKALRRRTHQAIQKLTDDIASLSFNTAVAEMMKMSDTLRKFVQANGAESPAVHEAAETLVKLLAPMAPHIADELWERLGYTERFVYNEPWSTADPAVAAEEEITLVVQVNGKLRDRLTVPADADNATLEAAALASDKVQEHTSGLTVRKVIVVPGKLVNIVAN
ncbi:MAG: leucine--tRNA ligase [Armatimonadaceae bacterium]